MTQLQMLREHLTKKGSISPVEAFALYRINSFHRRIADLKADGWSLKSVRRVDPTGRPYNRVYLDQ